jgi:hypothetical protein
VLPVLEKYRAIIRDYKITVFEEAGSSGVRTLEQVLGFLVRQMQSNP